MDSIAKKRLTAAATTLLLATSACGEPVYAAAYEIPSASLMEYEPITTPAEPNWPQEELQAMARTLAGECYDDMEQDKRLVCEVILNRVSDGRFGKSVCEVLESPNQFSGYWHQSRPVSENDLIVAEQALNDWYGNDCKALSEYLYFCAGTNRENKFR